MTTPTTVNVQFQLRADTAANWTAANPILLANELGRETDTGKFKVGDGSTAWSSLAYQPWGALITNAEIAANAEIAVSKLANGTANQVIVTDGTNVSWSDDLTLAGNLTVNGTTTTVNTETLVVEDKNIELGVVGTPTDLTADGGGITLKGTTDKTINWIDATDAWTSSERFSVPLGSEASPSLTFTGDENSGLYSPGADQLALSTNGVQRINIEADGDINIDSGGVFYDATNNRLAIGTTSPSNSLHVNAGASAGAALFETTTSVADIFLKDTGTVLGDVRVRSFSGSLVLLTDAKERARIDSSGRLLVGTSSGRNVGTGSQATLQVEGTSYNAISVVNNTNDVGAGSIRLGKSRGTTNGSNTIVQNNDGLGSIIFAGADGTDLQTPAAYISAQVDGTPGANDMPGRLVFSTTADGASSPTERMRITSGGDILFGTTGVPNGTSIYGAAFEDASNDRQILKTATSVTTSSSIVAFYNPNGLVGTISVGGSATAYNTSSDYRLKENVTPVTDGITRLQQLKPSRFNFIADPGNTVDGFIAHEVQTVVPEAITGEKDAVDDDGNPVYQGIDQSKLVPLLTAALQEAIGEIESLKARVVALESA